MPWFKFDSTTPDKPEVFQLSRILGCECDSVVGKLARFWAWADVQTVDGSVDGVALHDIDAIVRCTGFAQALAQVGWLICTDDNTGVHIPNFESHMGKSAKKRALKSNRQRKWREKAHVQNVDVVPSLDKRREDISDKPNGLSCAKPQKAQPKAPNRTKRFEQFWATYPKKRNKKRSREIWQRKQLDGKADLLIADIAKRKTDDERWLAGYIVDPTTYLNQERWDDEYDEPKGKPNGTHQQSLTGNAASYAVAEEWARDQIAGTDTERTIDGEARRVHATPVAKVR